MMESLALHVGVPLGAGGLGSIGQSLGCEPGGYGLLSVPLAGDRSRLWVLFDEGSWQVWGEPEELGVGYEAHLVVEVGDEPDVRVVGAIWEACSLLVPTAGPADGFMVLSRSHDWEREVCSFVMSSCLGVDPWRMPAPNPLRGSGVGC